MARIINDLVNVEEAEANREGTGSKQKPGGWTGHSPKGGIVMSGKYFKGGQFIPNADLENASPEELQNLANALHAGNQGGKAPVQPQVEGAGNLNKKEPEAPQVEDIPIKDYVYVVGTGELVNKPYTEYGDVVLRNYPSGAEFKPGHKEVELLNALGTKELYYISDHLIMWFKADKGVWPQNILPLKQDDIKVEEFAPLFDLNKDLVKVLTKTQKPVKMSLIRQEKVNNLWQTDKGMFYPHEKPSRISLLFRMYKVFNEEFPNCNEIEAEGDRGVILDKELPKNISRNPVIDSLFNITGENPYDVDKVSETNPYETLTNWEPYKSRYTNAQMYKDQVDALKALIHDPDMQVLMYNKLDQILPKIKYQEPNA